MKKLIIVMALCAMAFTSTRASIEVSLTDSAVQTIFTAQNPGESDIAQFSMNVTLYAVDGDAYIPSIAELAFDTDWHNADPFISELVMNLTSTADSSGGYFLIQEGDQEQFAVSVVASATQDTSAWLEIIGLNWASEEGGTLATLTFEQEIETDSIFINTHIVPEPGTLMMVTIGGLISIVTLRRRKVT